MSNNEDQGLTRSSVFRQLFDAHQAPLLHAAQRQGCGKQSAEDVVQSTLQVAWIKLSSLFRIKPQISFASVCAWVRGIEKNKLHEHFRRKKHHAMISETENDGEPGPDEVAALAEDLQRTADALERLDPDDQEVLRLFFWEDLKPLDVGSRLGLSPSGALMRRLRAVRRLGRVMGLKDAEGIKRDNP